MAQSIRVGEGRGRAEGFEGSKGEEGFEGSEGSEGSEREAAAGAEGGEAGGGGDGGEGMKSEEEGRRQQARGKRRVDKSTVVGVGVRCRREAEEEEGRRLTRRLTRKCQKYKCLLGEWEGGGPFARRSGRQRGVKETRSSERREGSKKREKGVSERKAALEKKGEPSRRGWTERFREIGG